MSEVMQLHEMWRWLAKQAVVVGQLLGESLRSLEVELGSVDGHDDGDRHGPMHRVPMGDLQPPARLQRSSGNAISAVSGRDTPLESVSEILQYQNQGNDQSALHEEPQSNGTVDADTLDPTFLEALPEELLAEVLSSWQNQVAQTSTEQLQADEDIDPEFLAALPADILQEVLTTCTKERTVAGTGRTTC